MANAGDAIGGRGVAQRGIPPARRRARLRLPSTQAESAQSVAQLIARLQQRIPGWRSVTSGQIEGNALLYGYQRYPLLSLAGVGKDTTVSGALGEGVFMLRPIPASAIARLAGHAYGAFQVSPNGGLHPTAVQFVINGLGLIQEGLLVYSPRVYHAPTMTITVRRPADVAALTQRIRGLLVGAIYAPGITVNFIIDAIESAHLTSAEFKTLIKQLKQAGLLGRFFNLIQVKKFRQFLKRQSLSWDYIFSHWEPSINDSGLVLMGYIAGVAQNYIEAFKLIGVMIGAPFSQSLAKQRDQFFAAIRKFFKHPWSNMVKGLKGLYRAFVDALWNLKFFEAGRILGSVVITLLTLPTVIKSLPKAARALARATAQLVKLTATQLKQLGLTARALRDFLRQPAQRVVTPEGIVLMTQGDDIAVLRPSGSAVGRITKADIDKLLSKLDELEQGKPPGKKGGKALSAYPSVADIRQAVRLAANDLKQQGVKGLSRPRYGSALHDAVAKRLAQLSPAKGWKIFVEQPLSDIVPLSKQVANMKVSTFLRKNPHLAKQLSDLPAKTRGSRIGSLQPDLIVKAQDGAYIVWDLTSQPHTGHLSKTLLYSSIIAQDNILVHIGESFWLAPKLWR